MASTSAAKSAVEFAHMFKLSNGVMMPQIGIGMWQAQGAAARNAALEALRLGYRHIDTAAIYGNEVQVGEAIVASGIPREKIFITSKLATADHGYEEALEAFNTSLQKLKTDYLDLYLIHWPGKSKLPRNSPKNLEARKASWRALEQLYSEGRIRAIGVSNYTVSHLREMQEYATVTPHVNQVEYHPYLYQKELHEYCKKHGIQLEAYSSLGSGNANLLSNPTVRAIADSHKKSVAHVLLRWALEQEIPVIPKSTHAERIKENYELFDFHLSKKDMEQLGSMNQDLHTCWDPREVA